MGSVFGMSDLKSKLDAKWDDWRKGQKLDDLASAHSQQKQANGSRDRDNELSNLLETLVIPKLIANRDKCLAPSDFVLPQLPTASSAGMDFRDADFRDAQADNDVMPGFDVEIFAKLSVEGEAHQLLEFVDTCLEAGHSVETLYVMLLAPAARRLGEYWENDSEDFVAVTMGLWRIQEILRELTLRSPAKSQVHYGRRTALFSTMPGEQHSLGTLMVAECFQRAGWDADVLIEPTQSELNHKLAEHAYDLIGLTITRDCPCATLTSLVASIKSISKNAKIRIMMGGRVIQEQPELIAQCGADGTAQNAVCAVDLADRLVPVDRMQYQSQAMAS